MSFTESPRGMETCSTRTIVASRGTGRSWMASGMPGTLTTRCWQVAVVAHHVSGYLFDARYDNGVGHFRKNACGIAVEFFFHVEWKFSVGEIGIATADEDYIAR